MLSKHVKVAGSCNYITITLAELALLRACSPTRSSTSGGLCALQVLLSCPTEHHLPTFVAPWWTLKMATENREGIDRRALLEKQREEFMADYQRQRDELAKVS